MVAHAGLFCGGVRQMNARDTSFFPLNNAIVLKEHKEREERGTHELLNDVRDVARQMAGFGRQIELPRGKVVGGSSAVNAKVSSITVCSVELNRRNRI